MDGKEIVRKGYDIISAKYSLARSRFKNGKELSEFSKLLPAGAKVLDVGCGAGVPVSKYLSRKGFDVTGIDFSHSMVELARKNVPEAEFIRADMTKLSFPKESFDGLVALYSIIHVPREKHRKLFRDFHRILKKGAVVLVCLGADEWEGTANFFGTEMFWSQNSPENSLEIIKGAGFSVISGKVLVRGGERHYWVLARKK